MVAFTRIIADEAAGAGSDVGSPHDSAVWVENVRVESGRRKIAPTAVPLTAGVECRPRLGFCLLA